MARVRDCGQALQLPGPGRPGGRRAAARGRVELQRLAGRPHLYVHDPGPPSLLRRHGRECRELQLRDRPACKPCAGVARRRVHHRFERHEHRRRQGGQRRPGDARAWRDRQGPPAGHPPHASRPHVSDEARDAVLPGDLAEAAADEGEDRQLPDRRAVHVPQKRAQRRDRAGPKLALPRDTASSGRRREGALERRRAGRLPPGRGRKARRRPVAGCRGQGGRRPLRREQDALLGGAPQLPRLPRVESQPAAVRPQRRAPAGAQLGRRPARCAGTRAAVLRLAVDAPAGAGISRLGHCRAPPTLCRRAEPEQGSPARGRPHQAGDGQRRLPELELRSGSARRSSSAPRSRRSASRRTTSG